MKVYHLQINHITKPLGYWFRTLTATWKVADAHGKRQKLARITVAKDLNMSKIIYDTEMREDLSALGTELHIKLEPRTRYYWQVQVQDETGETGISSVEWFETALLEAGLQAMAISPEDSNLAPIFVKKFFLEQLPKRARLYMTCLGVYELFINGKRVGQEELAPGLTCYDDYVQYQTYDVGEYLKVGENLLEVWAGDGWYKGKYGYRQNPDYPKNKEYVLMAQLFADENCVLKSDLSWSTVKNPISESDMYDGEVFDALAESGHEMPVIESKFDPSAVKERIGVPVKVKEIIQPVDLFVSSAGEMILDMGQNMTGRVKFWCREPKGSKILLEHGEILQDGCFFRENYRTAKARYEYISDGKERQVGARLCFFGFRYVRITGMPQAKLEDFCGEILYSDLESTGEFVTGHQALNKLFENILWSQKGNFLDIPTDCPQRDEKMGWTGDAQIFASTACMNMECYPFFRKYLNDIAIEQTHTGGRVPQIVPSVGRNGLTSAAWGDAAVIIPWTMYVLYGDKSILQEQYHSMKQWVAYIDHENEIHHTNADLWENGFHYGDWLALDGGYYHMPQGGTQIYYLSSAYFFYSTYLLSKAAAVLGKVQEALHYSEKAERIRMAILKEYFTASGRIAMDTQTGYIVALVFGIVKEKEMLNRIKEDFLKRLRMDEYHIKTGFVGTPFMLKALSMCRREDLAYRMLLNEEFPGWLYMVQMGATTMWERWDAVLPDGTMSDKGMNSLNHYANGAVAAWMYETIGGITPFEEHTGYSVVCIAPKPCRKLNFADIKMATAAGTYQVSWKYMEHDQFQVKIHVPFSATAKVELPYQKEPVRCNGTIIHIPENYVIEAGDYQYEYTLSEEAHNYYSLEDSVKELVRNSAIREYLYEKVPMQKKIDGADIQNMTLREMSELPFFLGIGTQLGLGKGVLEEIEKTISKIKKEDV